MICRASSFHHLVNALKKHLGDRNGEGVPRDVHVWLDIFAGVFWEFLVLASWNAATA